MQKLYFHSKPSRKGRVTVAGVLDDAGYLHLGAAKCSRRDEFDKRLGRLIAAGRAIHEKATVGKLALTSKPAVVKIKHGAAATEIKQLTVGLWFKMLAEELSARVMSGKINPRYPNTITSPAIPTT